MDEALIVISTGFHRYFKGLLLASRLVWSYYFTCYELMSCKPEYQIVITWSKMPYYDDGILIVLVLMNWCFAGMPNG